MKLPHYRVVRTPTFNRRWAVEYYGIIHRFFETRAEARRYARLMNEGQMSFAFVGHEHDMNNQPESPVCSCHFADGTETGGAS